MAVIGLLTCLVTADTALSQQRGGFGRGMQTRARYELATLPEVQGELKLTDEQKKLAADLLAKQREKRSSFGQGGDFQAMRAELMKMNQQFDGELVAKLDDKQKSRLNGLLIQVNGAATLLDTEIAKQLQISEEQTGKLKSTNDANMSARREAMQGLQDATPEARQAAMEKATAEANTKLLALLNDDQKKKFDELKGPALTIDQAPLRTQGRARN